MTWRNPLSLKSSERIGLDEIWNVCERWQGGATIKDLPKAGIIGMTAIAKILSVNFVAQWEPGRWLPLNQDPMSIHAHAINAPHALYYLFRTRTSRRIQTRKRLTGDQPETPPIGVRCDDCDVEWLLGERGCVHTNDRWHQQCEAACGDRYRGLEPDLMKLKLPLTSAEVRLLGESIRRAVNHAHKAYAAALKIEADLAGR